MLRCSVWRRNPESNRDRRICNPLHSHSAIPPDASGAWLKLISKRLERETRFELATPTLARSCSTNWAIPACLNRPFRLVDVLSKCGVHSTYPFKTVNTKKRLNWDKCGFLWSFAIFLFTLINVRSISLYCATSKVWPGRFCINKHWPNWQHCWEI